MSTYVGKKMEAKLQHSQILVTRSKFIFFDFECHSFVNAMLCGCFEIQTPQLFKENCCKMGECYRVDH